MWHQNTLVNPKVSALGNDEDSLYAQLQEKFLSFRKACTCAAGGIFC